MRTFVRLGATAIVLVIILGGATAAARTGSTAPRAAEQPNPICQPLEGVGLGTIPLVCEQPPPAPPTPRPPTSVPPATSTTSSTVLAPVVSLPTPGGSSPGAVVAPAPGARPSPASAPTVATTAAAGSGPMLVVPVVSGPSGGGVGHLVALVGMLGVGALWLASRSMILLTAPRRAR